MSVSFEVIKSNFKKETLTKAQFSKINHQDRRSQRLLTEDYWAHWETERDSYWNEGLRGRLNQKDAEVLQLQNKIKVLKSRERQY